MFASSSLRCVKAPLCCTSEDDLRRVIFTFACSMSLKLECCTFSAFYISSANLNICSKIDFIFLWLYVFFYITSVSTAQIWYKTHSWPICESDLLFRSFNSILYSSFCTFYNWNLKKKYHFKKPLVWFLAGTFSVHVPLVHVWLFCCFQHPHAKDWWSWRWRRRASFTQMRGFPILSVPETSSIKLYQTQTRWRKHEVVNV